MQISADTCLHFFLQPAHDDDSSHPIAPDIQMSTTYRKPGPKADVWKDFEENGGEGGLDWQTPPMHIYSRYTSETRGRVEKVLSQIMDANALTYASGLTAAYAAIIHYSPSVVAIRRGYHGVHAGLNTYRRSRSDLKIIDLDDDYPDITTTSRDGTPNGGLLVWVESPLNPTSEARDIKHYAERAHKVGGTIVVDSTLAPLQKVFALGADMAMHSATKYLAGHSDLLAGVLATKSTTEWKQLFFDRSNIGGMPGNFEAWLLLRSLRTLQVRWKQQSNTALQIARWLQSLVVDADEPSKDAEDQHIIKAKMIRRVWHASFQPRKDKDPARIHKIEEGGKNFDPSEQMAEGWPATFAFRLSEKKLANQLPHETRYFSVSDVVRARHVMTLPDFAFLQFLIACYLTGWSGITFGASLWSRSDRGSSTDTN